MPGKVRYCSLLVVFQVKTGDVIDLIRKDECNNDVVKFDSVKVLEMLEKTLKGKQRVLLSRKRGIVLEWRAFKDRFGLVN